MGIVLEVLLHVTMWTEIVLVVVPRAGQQHSVIKVRCIYFQDSYMYTFLSCVLPIDILSLLFSLLDLIATPNRHVDMRTIDLA